MKAALMNGPGSLSLEEVADPAQPQGGAILELMACAVCGTDAKMLENGHRDLIYPRILGHEMVGRIASIDRRTHSFREGDVVQVWPGIACGECRPCQRGHDNQCHSMGILGFNRDGGFAQRMAVPAESFRAGGMVMLPEDIDPALVTLTEPLACCLNGQELASVGAGDAVLIFGAGPIGCLHALAARTKGATSVLMTEHLESRRRLLPSGLVDRIIDPSSEDIAEVVTKETAGEGVDVVLMSTPEVRVDSWILKLMAPHGRISVFSGPKKGSYEVPFDVRTLHYREISLLGAYGCSSRHNREAVRLLLSGDLRAEWLVTERASLDDICSAFKHVNDRQGMKSVITRF
jgi:L-iditol 2-dehydrogenase